MVDEMLGAVAAPVAVLRPGESPGLTVVAANTALAEALGMPLAALPGRSAESVLPKPLVRALESDQGADEAAGEVLRLTVPLGDGGPLHEARVRRLARPAAARPDLVVTFVPAFPEALGASVPEILDLQSELVSRWRPDGTIVYCNEAFARQCGRPRSAVVGANLFALTPPSEVTQILANLARLSPASPTSGYDHRIVAPDGSERWQEWIDRGSFDAEGRLVAILSVGRDITARKQAERQLARSEQRLGLALEAGNLGVWETDLVTDRVRLDRSCLTQLGWSPAEAELSVAEIRARMHPRDRARVQRAYNECRRGERAKLRLEYRVRRPDGRHVWIEEHALVAERDADGRPLRLVGVATDISARKEAEMRLAHLALHDPLTGLPNRRALAEALDRAIARAERSGLALAVLCLDLDGFKAINDRHGHPAGDAALVEVGARLRRTVRRSDVVARLGGDEFAVIAGDLKGPTPVVRLARRIGAALAEPLALPTGRSRVGVSIGVAFYPGDGNRPDLLLGSADRALYAAKRDGVGCRLCADLPEAAATA